MSTEPPTTITITSDDLSDLPSLLETTNGPANLHYSILLPAYDFTRAVLFETLKEQESNNSAFTTALISLFILLSTTPTPTIDLTLTAYSPTDLGHRDENSDDTYDIDATGDIGARRWRHSYLTFLPSRLHVLPEVKCIRSFICRTPLKDRNRLARRMIEGATLARLCGTFPGLEVLRWEVAEGNFLYPELRKRHRNEFGTALLDSHKTWKKLRIFHIEADAGTSAHFNLATGPDPLTEALRHVLVLPALEEFLIGRHAVLAPNIFDPLPDSAGSFRELKKITVHLSPALPDGGSYYSNPNPPASDKEEDVPEDAEDVPDEDEQDYDSDLPPNYNDPASNTPRRDALLKLERTIDHVLADLDESETATTDEDGYPYPPRYGREYSRAYRAAEVEGYDEGRASIDTEEARRLVRGFVGLVARAEKLREGLMHLGSDVEIFLRIQFSAKEACWSVQYGRTIEPELGGLFKEALGVMRGIKGGTVVTGLPEEVLGGLEEEGKQGSGDLKRGANSEEEQGEREAKVRRL
ncbi:hypothetical protein BJ508DRAFT_417399 [Ascobolus immersus RN42]|uniref:Uncharacterized protein n=1 Tax=Ascobolus immersus RN42 TaxID=1160509 RepID=A0A3N4HYI5_ASCIM|nr:hypothetical protein BJ508DRAFT_417399 [Ascobolus immersus RN42]